VVDAVSPPAAAAPAPVKPPAKSPPPAEKSSTVATNGVATTDPRELSTAEAPPPATAAAAAAPAPAIEPPAPAVEPPAVMAEAKEPAPVEAPAPVAPAAEPEPIEVAAPLPATADSPPAPVAELPGPAIVFAVNSSFFSGSASRDLRAFVDQLPPDAEVEIELAAAVGTGDVRDADPVEAKRYNAWMAERRLQRVAEWLTSNAGPRQLKLNEHYIENDPSREVRLRARVLP
jgi:hypothetical protein